MKEISVKIKGVKNLNPILEIDGQHINIVKNQYGNYEGKFQTEKGRIDVKVYRVLEINSKLWFLKHLFYYIISIFGLLDTRREKKFIVIDCQFQVDLQNTDQVSIELSAQKMLDQGRAFEIVSNSTVAEHTNTYFVDKKAKKRNRLLRVFKVIVFLGTICGIAIGFWKILGF